MSRHKHYDVPFTVGLQPKCGILADMTLHAYLPQDRLAALARGTNLASHTNGSALFADISGFTPLTEALHESLGPRRGAEELSDHLNAVYSVLIAQVERYGGSVIDFAGDAMLCWFDEAHSRAAGRATACACALQQAMQPFGAVALPHGATAALTLKVAVTTGPARRFVVGDPAIQRMDVLVGTTIARTSTAEHLAQKGDILLDEATVQALGAGLSVRAWRTDHKAQERFAVIMHYADQVAAFVAPELASRVDAADLQTWVLRSVYQREQSEQGAFLTEFRPCVALFVHFTGIDYDTDEAETQLDAFLRQAQAVVARYDGRLLELTIGDKGSYTYINFGALGVHEDDARRALKTALTLCEEARALGYLAPLQIGVTRGLMRVGAYGGLTRRRFGALGDDVNLAARLMQTAAPDEILVSGHVHKAVAHDFSFEPHPPLAMKGKAEPLPVFALTGERQQRALRLQEPSYALPMVGRQWELQVISEKLDLALQGRAQVIGIVADAGLGKSRLVAEVIRLARRKGFTGYGGACQSDGSSTPYLAWQGIWSAFFDVDPAAPLRKQIRLLEGEVDDLAPQRLQALPLLGPLLSLDIPDNDVTQTLEPKFRQSALHALLEDCLKAAVAEAPLLIVLEDLHWIDGLSHDLLEELARALVDCRICFVLAYRPPQLARLLAPRLEALPSFTRIELRELTAAEGEQAIRAKLAQLYPARGGAVPPLLVEKLMAHAQGNPFYLEELLNFLRDRGLDPRDPADLNRIELPDSLHTLILSRIDQLSPSEKTTLRVASIVGRLFRAAWLTGYYPALGTMPQVKADLDQLHELDITPRDNTEPELAYLFKHIVTHEVTYESLPFATRAELHEQLAQYLERSAASIETIAYHYGQSHNQAKQREYWEKAGEAAQAAYANDAAVDHYTRLLPLVAEPGARIDLHLKRGAVLLLMGRWDESEADSRAGLALAEQTDDTVARVRCHLSLNELAIRRGDFASARRSAKQALAAAEALADLGLLAQSAFALSYTDYWLGDLASAQTYGEKALAAARTQGDLITAASALRTLAAVAAISGRSGVAESLYEECLPLSRQAGDKSLLVDALHGYGVFLRGRRIEYAAAQACHAEELTLVRETGDKLALVKALSALGCIVWLRGLFAEAQSLQEQALSLARALGSQRWMGEVLWSLGEIRLAQGRYLDAQRAWEEASALYRESGHKNGLAAMAYFLGMVALATQQLAVVEAHLTENRVLQQEMGDQDMAAGVMGLLRILAALQGQPIEADQLHAEALIIVQQMEQGVEFQATLCNVGLAACLQHDYVQAQQYYLESLKYFWPTEYRGFEWARAWAGTAMMALRQAPLSAHGVQLAAFAEEVLRQMGAVIWPIERAPFDAALAAARAALGAEAFSAAWAQGQTMSIDEALALAWELDSSKRD